MKNIDNVILIITFYLYWFERLKHILECSGSRCKEELGLLCIKPVFVGKNLMNFTYYGTRDSVANEMNASITIKEYKKNYFVCES